MPNAFRTDVQRAPDRFRPRGLASMGGKTQPGVSGFFIQVAEPFRRSASFIAANSHAHNVAVTQLGGKV